MTRQPLRSEYEEQFAAFLHIKEVEYGNDSTYENMTIRKAYELQKKVSPKIISIVKAEGTTRAVLKTFSYRTQLAKLPNILRDLKKNEYFYSMVINSKEAWWRLISGYYQSRPKIRKSSWGWVDEDTFVRFQKQDRYGNGENYRYYHRRGIKPPITPSPTFSVYLYKLVPEANFSAELIKARMIASL